MNLGRREYCEPVCVEQYQRDHNLVYLYCTIFTDFERVACRFLRIQVHLLLLKLMVPGQRLKRVVVENEADEGWHGVRLDHEIRNR